MTDTAVAISPEEKRAANEARIRAMPVHIVLAIQPLSNSYHGLIEQSFSMEWDANRVNMFWTGTAYSMLGTHQLDGAAEAEEHRKLYAARHPDWRIEVYDAKSDDCPVEINWDNWVACMVAGSKYGARNAYFTIKDL